MLRQHGRMDFDEFYDVFGQYFNGKKQKYGNFQLESNEREATCFICPSEEMTK